MDILYKRIKEGAQLPKKQDGLAADFCYDCIAISEEEVAPNVWKYGLGFAVQPVGSVDLNHIRGINVRARSSVWKTGMILSNGVGTVDELYTGELSVVFYHVMPTMPRYRVGDRVCQICLEQTTQLNFIESETLHETARGEHGYGHTGLR